MRKRFLILPVLLFVALAVSAAGGERDVPPPPGPFPETPAVREPVDGPSCVGTNLLQNGSFEGAYSAYVPPNGHPDCPAGICQTAQMAAGWTPFWQSHDPADPGYIIRMPEYKPAEYWYTNPDRVRSGSRAQQYFTFYSTHRAGLYQRVAVNSGERYCFSVFGHAWSAETDDDAYSDPTPLHGVLNQKVGIDPSGGTNWTSGAILWGPERMQYDYYGAFLVEATAQQNQLTVYMHSQPQWAVKHNDVYWDDASLVRVTFDAGDAADFVQSPGGSGVEAQTVPVTLTGSSATTWTAVVQGGAQMPVSVTPSGGVDDDLVVTVDGTGLSAGFYAAEVVVSPSSGLPDRTVTVSLLVADLQYQFFLPLLPR